MHSTKHLSKIYRKFYHLRTHSWNAWQVCIQKSRKHMILSSIVRWYLVRCLQKILPFEDTLMKCLTGLYPKEQKTHDSVKYCKVISGQMPSIQPQEVEVGDEWIQYQKFALTEDDVKLTVDHFWHKVPSKVDLGTDKFAALPKLWNVLCPLAIQTGI